MFTEMQKIKCSKDEIARFQKFEADINKEIDNLLILVSTGGLVFSSNLIQHLSYQPVVFKISWIILILGILFSLLNRIITSEKTTFYLSKFYKADRENKDFIEVPKFLSTVELFFCHGAYVFTFLGIILLATAFIIKI